MNRIPNDIAYKSPRRLCTLFYHTADRVVKRFFGGIGSIAQEAQRAHLLIERRVVIVSLCALTVRRALEIPLISFKSNVLFVYFWQLAKLSS